MLNGAACAASDARGGEASLFVVDGCLPLRAAWHSQRGGAWFYPGA
ncbi:hypothetical protein BURPS305_6256 [Burkholderia pseudomallei 305]|nr:hypothetical protein BURPS305_6256 [Burkholderia pseudomallei 305]EDU12222.1 hypothetical protein BURPS1655_D1098 [Burkholderia pseudomallei 1655]EEP50422.1 conserved hypothetical protein [Burkholderia pseudomallei MSHR346]